MTDENKPASPQAPRIPPTWLSPQGAIRRLGESRDVPDQAREKLISAVHQGEIAHRVNGLIFIRPFQDRPVAARAGRGEVFITALDHPQVGRITVNDWTAVSIDWQTGDFIERGRRIAILDPGDPIQGWISIWWPDAERVLGPLCRPRRVGPPPTPPARTMSVDEAVIWMRNRSEALNGRIKRDDLIAECVAAAKNEGSRLDRKSAREAFTKFAAASGRKVGRPPGKAAK